MAIHFCVLYDNSVIPVLWKAFVCAPMRFLNLVCKNFPHIILFGLNWNILSPCWAIRPNIRATSLKLRWLNESRSLQPASKILCKAFPEECGGCHSNLLNGMFNNQIQVWYLGVCILCLGVHISCSVYCNIYTYILQYCPVLHIVCVQGSKLCVCLYLHVLSIC